MPSITQESKDAVLEALKSRAEERSTFAIPKWDEQLREWIMYWLTEALAVVESFPVSDGWIPVSERLPEWLQWCHTFGEMGMVDACWYPKQNIWVHPQNLHGWIHVTHWQPFPTPPKTQ